MKRSFALLVAVLLVLPLVPARAADEPARGALYDRAVSKMLQTFPDAKERITALGASHRPAALAAETVDEEREAIFDFLAGIPSSHTGVLTAWGTHHLLQSLRGKDDLSLGLDLVEEDGGWYVSTVERGGSAWWAGVVRGDRVLSIDGRAPEDSPRVDFRHDDAASDDLPSHWLRCDEAEPCVLELRHRRSQETSSFLALVPTVWSPLRADEAGVRTRTTRGHRIGVIPLSLVYLGHTVPLVRDAITGPLTHDEAFVLDARGHGGGAGDTMRLLDLLSKSDLLAGRPIVLVVDHGTRSAKEILADGFRRRGIGPIVGERTLGAVRPVRFLDIGEETTLFCPLPGSLAKPRFALEGHGVPPDLLVHDALPYADGADPILEAGLDAAARFVERPARDEGGVPPALRSRDDVALGRSALDLGDLADADRHAALALARARTRLLRLPGPAAEEALAAAEHLTADVRLRRGLRAAAATHQRAAAEAEARAREGAPAAAVGR